MCDRKKDGIWFVTKKLILGYLQKLHPERQNQNGDDMGINEDQGKQTTALKLLHVQRMQDCQNKFLLPDNTRTWSLSTGKPESGKEDGNKRLLSRFTLTLHVCAQ